MGEAAAKGEKWFMGITIMAILLNSIFNVLARERVLEFGSEDRQSIQEKHKVQAILIPLAISQLAHLAEDVGGIQFL